MAFARSTAVWLLVLAVCAWSYWPGLASPPLLDDAVNLQVLSKLEDNPEYLGDIVSGNRSGLLGRSVSMWSFGLEKLYFDRGLFGSKLVNLILHLSVGCLVALFSVRVLRFLGVTEAAGWGLFVGSAWLLSPLLLSTVLYTVQRMAQLSTMFSLLAVYAFIEMRIRQIEGRRAWLIGLMILPFLVVGLLAKENAVVVLPLILISEWTLFRFASPSSATSALIQRSFYVLLAASCIVVAYILVTQPSGLMAAYSIRAFDLWERLLTQPGVLIHYISQLLLPDVSVMGVYHDDVTVARRIFDSFQTLISVGLVVALLFWALLRSPGKSPVAFGVLFFFAAHSLESTFLPLELYFEHRNYLPAVGLFIGVAGGLSAAIRSFPAVNAPVIVVVLLWLGHLLYWTSYQAVLWSNPYTLHFAAVNGHPNSLRANTEMARLYAEQGHIDQAMIFSQRVKDLEPSQAFRHDMRDLVLFCLAKREVPSHRLQQITVSPELVADLQANEIFQLLIQRIMDGHCPSLANERLADRFAELLHINGRPVGTRKIYSMLASFENHLGRYDAALAYTELLLHKAPDDHKGLLMKLYFGTLLERPGVAADARARLERLAARGELSDEEQYNLSLFPAAPE